MHDGARTHTAHTHAPIIRSFRRFMFYFLHHVMLRFLLAWFGFCFRRDSNPAQNPISIHFQFPFSFINHIFASQQTFRVSGCWMRPICRWRRYFLRRDAVAVVESVAVAAAAAADFVSDAVGFVAVAAAAGRPT